jgi:hypothetical protein
MPLLGFSPQFAALVESGEKRQTIRAWRKFPICVGDRVYLWTGLRQPGARKLGEGIVESVDAIRIERNRARVRTIPLWDSGRVELAKDDGFESFDAMAAWFERTHGLPFTGTLIRWRLVARAEWKKP